MSWPTIAFSPFMFPNTARLAGANYTPSVRGAGIPAFPDATAFRASVQPKSIRRVDSQGMVITESGWHIFLEADPGCRADDIWILDDYGYRAVSALGPAVPTGGGQTLWKVVCKELV